MPRALKTRIKETGNVDKTLAKIQVQLRGKTLTKAVRAAGQVVAKEAARLAPEPGYAGDVPGKTPLRKTIKTVVRQYKNGIVSFTGPIRPDGAHGHLVEYGHRLVAWGVPTNKDVPPHPFLRPAADSTQSEQQRVIIATLRKEAERLGK